MDYRSDLFDLIGDLARLRFQAAERDFAVLGLNHTEARLLTLLARAGGRASQEALSAQISIDRSNTGRALKHLEHAGHIERVRDEGDKRTFTVQITPRGESTVADIERIRSGMAQRFFGALSNDDAGTIVSLLTSAMKSLSRE